KELFNAGQQTSYSFPVLFMSCDIFPLHFAYVLPECFYFKPSDFFGRSAYLSVVQFPIAPN
ncbi:MAG: hypothetical protein NC311_15080, partial [Muribaculaceae bacterium]|nr:hypothetical protein [Muribaculaceae bacterium]MCM1400342.1 hypothetical protein [Clostridium sp.]MCM1461061.1 hypothetical protein [Bacteroides sp.]